MAKWSDWKNIGSDAFNFLFGDNVNLNVSFNEYVKSASVNGGAVTWVGAYDKGEYNLDSLFLQTDVAFKISDYKYFMHTLSKVINVSAGLTCKCYLKGKTDGTLIPLSSHVIAINSQSFYTDLSTVEYDENEEYYLYFSMSTYKSVTGFGDTTGTYTLSNVVLY